MTDIITKDKIIITIGIAISLIATPIVYDNLILTDTEIQDVRDMAPFTSDEDFVYKTILLDKKKVEFDLSKISKKEVDDILLGTMLKLGIKQQDLIDKIMKGKQINFDEEIKKKSKEKTSFIKL